MTGGGHEITHKSLAQILQHIFEMKGCTRKMSGGANYVQKLNLINQINWQLTGFQIEYFMLISTGFLKHKMLRNNT